MDAKGYSVSCAQIQCNNPMIFNVMFEQRRVVKTSGFYKIKMREANILFASKSEKLVDREKDVRHASMTSQPLQ